MPPRDKQPRRKDSLRWRGWNALANVVVLEGNAGYMKERVQLVISDARKEASDLHLPRCHQHHHHQKGKHARWASSTIDQSLGNIVTYWAATWHLCRALIHNLQDTRYSARTDVVRMSFAHG